MSLLFYTWGGGAFVLWLLGSICLNYLLGLIAQHAHDDGKIRTTRYAIAGAAIVNSDLFRLLRLQ